MKHVKLATSETIVDQSAAPQTLDSGARAFVLVVHQNAIFRLVAGKMVMYILFNSVTLPVFTT